MKGWMSASAVLAGLAVVLGAFGAHGLRAYADVAGIEAFKTGAHYHLIHAVAMLCLCGMTDRVGERAIRQVLVLFAIGVLLFSGSLYLLAVVSLGPLGIVTPIGGLFFIAGWFRLAAASYPLKR